MRNPLRWVLEEIGAMGALFALTVISLVGWAYFAGVTQTPAQYYSFVGLVVLLLALFGAFHYLMNRERATAMQQNLERGYAEWCRYHEGAFDRVHRERMKAEEQRENMAELYARIKREYPTFGYAADAALPSPPRNWHGIPADQIELPSYHDDGTNVPHIDFGESDTVIDVGTNEAEDNTGITPEMVFADEDLIKPRVEDTTPSPPKDDDKKPTS